MSEQMTFEQLETGRKDPVMGAREWIADNPGGWLMMLGFAREFVAARRHFSAKLLAERVRYECKLVGVPYKIDNRCVSSFSRFILEAIPEAEPFIETRDGKYVRRVERGAA